MSTIYLPVAAADVLGIANDWNTEAVRAGKPGFTIITNTSTGFAKTGRRLFGGESPAEAMIAAVERLCAAG